MGARPGQLSRSAGRCAVLRPAVALFIDGSGRGGAWAVPRTPSRRPNSLARARCGQLGVSCVPWYHQPLNSAWLRGLSYVQEVGVIGSKPFLHFAARVRGSFQVTSVPIRVFACGVRARSTCFAGLGGGFLGQKQAECESAASAGPRAARVPNPPEQAKGRVPAGRCARHRTAGVGIRNLCTADAVSIVVLGGKSCSTPGDGF